MHVAAKNGKADFVKAAIAAMSGNAQFDAKDAKGNTVYHYAAMANKETVEVIQLSKIFSWLHCIFKQLYLIPGVSFLRFRWND